MLAHTNRRSASCVTGAAANRPFIQPDMAGSRLGMIHGGVRWKSVIFFASGWIRGTNWIALAPVPITATRRPVRSTEWSHCAEWNEAPANVSRPAMSGIFGRFNWPTADTTTLAVRSPVVPSALRTVTVHSCVVSFHAQPVTSAPKRTSGSTPKRSAQSRKYCCSTARGLW